MNVSKHRKEGREDGRTPLPREMCSPVLVHITHTKLAAQQNLIWHVGAMRSLIRSIPASGHQTLTVLPGSSPSYILTPDPNLTSSFTTSYEESQPEDFSYISGLAFGVQPSLLARLVQLFCWPLAP